MSAVLRARAEHGEWLCALDEPEWLLPGPVPAAITEALLQAAAKGKTGSLAASLASFIDCRWPLDHLAEERSPG